MHRRHLLAASLFGLTPASGGVEPRPLPPVALRERDPEAYWAKIREDQFLLPPWRHFLNNGSLGVTPRPVLAAMEQWLEHAASLVADDYPRWGYETLDAERAEMAAFLGCKMEELAFTHNCTEAMSTVVAGLRLKSGDEVVMTDHEHVSGKAPWHLKAKRDGVVIREVKIPHPPRNAGQLADLMISSLGPRTRVLFFSGILSHTGVVMPVREICRAARERGVITLVDGAHMNGQIPLRIAELGCDYYAGSPHKWMFAPAGCGILYIREENLDKIDPTMVTGDWDNASLKAARFMKIGTQNKVTIVGMLAGLRFLRELGAEAIYARIHQLARRNYEMARQRSYVQVLSSEDHTLYGALTCVDFGERDISKMWAALRAKRVWTLTSQKVRISTHIHTRPEDLEAFWTTADSVLA
jgi:selenocysteine lyase/cysteine desulfurase